MFSEELLLNIVSEPITRDRLRFPRGMQSVYAHGPLRKGTVEGNVGGHY